MNTSSRLNSHVIKCAPVAKALVPETLPRNLYFFFFLDRIDITIFFQKVHNQIGYVSMNVSINLTINNYLKRVMTLTYAHKPLSALMCF